MSKSLTRRGFLAMSGSAAALAGLGLAACGGGSTSTTDSCSSETKNLSVSITAVGSTALQPLVEAASEQFMETYPDVQITVQGGGSGQGITQISVSCTVGRIDTAEYNRKSLLESRQSLGGGVVRNRHSVAHTGIRNSLDGGGYIANFACRKAFGL